jgi:plastocyanin
MRAGAIASVTRRLAGIAMLVTFANVACAAEELPVYQLVARDGVFEPTTLEVAAGKRFKIAITNAGKGPMEFESRELRQEKVLAAGASSSIVINGLKPGSYTFFDDFHPDTGKGTIVAK